MVEKDLDNAKNKSWLVAQEPILPRLTMQWVMQKPFFMHARNQKRGTWHPSKKTGPLSWCKREFVGWCQIQIFRSPIFLSQIRLPYTYLGIYYAKMLAKMRSTTLSARGTANIATIVPKIPAQTSEDSYNIDMSIAENCLLRDELAAICKTAIKDKLISQVILPRAYAQNLSIIG